MVGGCLRQLDDKNQSKNPTRRQKGTKHYALLLVINNNKRKHRCTHIFFKSYLLFNTLTIKLTRRSPPESWKTFSALFDGQIDVIALGVFLRAVSALLRDRKNIIIILKRFRFSVSVPRLKRAAGVAGGLDEE